MPNLSDTKIRAAKPKHKDYKLYDSGGLFLLVTREGGRWWRVKYRFNGVERGMSCGIYPATSLQQARIKRDAAKKLLGAGKDPSAERKREKREALEAAARAKVAHANTFKLVAAEWLEKQERPTKDGKSAIAPITAKKQKWMLETFVYELIGDKAIAAIEPGELLELLERIERKGARHTAHRVRALCARVFKYGITTKRTAHNPARELDEALLPEKPSKRAAITDEARLGDLLRAIDGYDGDSSTKAALRILPHVFVRPGELRGAEWREFNFDDALWRIPARRMKSGRDFLVPLSRQVIEMLTDLRTKQGDIGRLVFPSPVDPVNPLSSNTLNQALRKLKFTKAEISAHGFRSTASTILNENSWSSDSIELQLAHRDNNKVRAVYNRSERLPDRRAMLEFWSDYLDALRLNKPKPKSSKVVPIREHVA